MLPVSVADKPDKLRFVSHFLDNKESTRTRELELAQRRSHAAKAAHKKRRGLQQAQYEKAIATPRLWHGNSDPFATLPISISSQDYDRLQAYRSILFHIIWPSRGNVVMYPISEDWNATVSTCLSDRSSAQALLALCLMWVKPRYSSLTHQNICTKELLRHRADSLSAVRAELGTFSGPWTPPLTLIMAIIFLTVGLAVAGDNAEASIHLKGLRQLVDAYGGFRTLPYIARGSIMGVDHAVSVAVKCPLAFSSTLYDPFPLNLSSRERRAYDDYFHAQPALPDCVPYSLRSTFTFHRDMIAVLDVALKCQDPVRRTELLHWVLLRRYVPYSETQEKCCALIAKDAIAALDPVSSGFLALQASVRVAAQYMFRLIYFPRPGQSAIFADFNVIQESLTIEEVRTLAPPDLLLWLTAIAACIERALRLTRHREWWHAPRFLLLAQNRGLSTADDVCQIARKLVWYDIPLKDHLEELFNQKDAIYDESNYMLNQNYQRVAMDGALTISWSNTGTKK